MFLSGGFWSGCNTVLHDIFTLLQGVDKVYVVIFHVTCSEVCLIKNLKAENLRFENIKHLTKLLISETVLQF